MERNLGSILRMCDDDNEHFIGEELNTEKMQRLNDIRTYCRQITEFEPSIKATFLPFSNRSRNGTAYLDFPVVIFCDDKRVRDLLSRILSLTDAFISTTLTGGLRLTFVVHDMWTKFGYDNDMEHGE